MKICKKCGCKAENQDIYCKKCGTRLEEKRGLEKAKSKTDNINQSIDLQKEKKSTKRKVGIILGIIFLTAVAGTGAYFFGKKFPEKETSDKEIRKEENVNKKIKRLLFLQNIFNMQDKIIRFWGMSLRK